MVFINLRRTRAPGQDAEWPICSFHGAASTRGRMVFGTFNQTGFGNIVEVDTGTGKRT